MATAAETDRERIVLDLEGMTCASCAARIEKNLNRLDGVDATVNFATEQATVACDPSVTVDELVRAVESAGYHAQPAPVRHVAHPEGGVREHHDEPAAALEQRLIAAIALTVPVAVLAMVPAVEFSGWGWVALALSDPVILWGGFGFHRAAFKAARHGAASMDSLISIGTLAAWGWSLVVLVGRLDADTYFEVGAVITTLILLGRYLEARAKGRSSEAIEQLLRARRERGPSLA